MKRIGITVAGVLLFAMTACGGDERTATPIPPGGSAATSGPATPTETPSASPSEAVEFTVDGAGPYLLDAKLADLQSGAGLDGVTTGVGACPENTSARGTGVWKDVQLLFRKDGLLYLAINRSTGIPTPSGAWLGTSLAELKTIYKSVSGLELRRASGTAYLVTTISGRGMLFELDAAQKVASMIAGDSTYLRVTYSGGGEFC